MASLFRVPAPLRAEAEGLLTPPPPPRPALQSDSQFSSIPLEEDLSPTQQIQEGQQLLTLMR